MAGVKRKGRSWKYCDMDLVGLEWNGHTIVWGRESLFYMETVQPVLTRNKLNNRRKTIMDGYCWINVNFAHVCCSGKSWCSRICRHGWWTTYWWGTTAISRNLMFYMTALMQTEFLHWVTGISNFAVAQLFLSLLIYLYWLYWVILWSTIKYLYLLQIYWLLALS